MLDWSAGLGSLIGWEASEAFARSRLPEFFCIIETSRALGTNDLYQGHCLPIFLRPILHGQLRNPAKFPEAVGYQCQPKAQGMRGNYKVVGADGRPFPFDVGAYLAIELAGANIQGQHGDQTFQGARP
jgi:hypothetical protein